MFCDLSGTLQALPCTLPKQYLSVLDCGQQHQMPYSSCVYLSTKHRGNITHLKVPEILLFIDTILLINPIYHLILAVGLIQLINHHDP